MIEREINCFASEKGFQTTTDFARQEKIFGKPTARSVRDLRKFLCLTLKFQLHLPRQSKHSLCKTLLSVPRNLFISRYL